MGRQVRRVALDFKWPLQKVWDGFVNPHYKKCEHCKGSGLTTARQRFGDLVSLIMMSGEDSQRGRVHPYFHSASLYHTGGKIPSADMVELTKGLAGRAPGGFGHDSLDRWSAEKKIIAAAGLPERWGYCPHCDGEGQDLSTKEAYDAWVKTDPPAGDGWQMWETVSEGSPLSPVFATPEGLARYMIKTRYGADEGTSYETWLKFIVGPGWSLSGVFVGGKSVNPIEDAVGE